MKTVFAFLVAASGCSAFAPSAVDRVARSSALKASELDSLYGVGPETGGKIFDPLNLNEFLPADFAREAELANGRSAMLATVGWVFPKYFGTFDSTDVTTTDPIKAIMEADPQWWAQFLLLCGTFEAYKYKQALAGKSYSGPGEPVLDYLKMYPKDEAGRKDIHMKELKNGRLAMIAMAGFFANYFIPGAVPGMPEGL